MRKALTYILFLFLAPALWAQDSLSVPKGKLIPMEGVFLEQLQERDSILIADQLLYGFELKQVPEGTRFVLPEIPQEQNQEYKLMYLGTWTWDTLKVNKAKKGLPRLLDLRASVKVTSFEEGVFELAPIAVQRFSGSAVADTLLFESMSLDVKTMPVDTATFVPHDIKAQIRYPLTFKELLPWILGVLALIALCLLIAYLIIRNRRKNDPAYDRREPAHIIALRKLDQYRGNKMWLAEKQKAFYSGITDTLREYIAARYNVSAMEMTTAEIFDIMKNTDAPQDLLQELKELFERADFVKFAKFVATDDDNASALPLAVRFVTETYQVELEAEETAAQQQTQEYEKEGGR